MVKKVKEGQDEPTSNTLSEQHTGNENITDQVDNGLNSVKGVLDIYEGFRKLLIEVNGGTREIYLENENLRVDSTDWEVRIVNGHNVKINSFGDITEYIDGPESGQQLFRLNTALREAKKLGKRLPYPNEFEAILKKIGVAEFMKVFPGFREPPFSDFRVRSNCAYFWTAGTYRDGAFCMEFSPKKFSGRDDTEYFIKWHFNNLGLSARCIRD